MPKVKPRIKAAPERDDDDDAPAPSRAATMRNPRLMHLLMMACSTSKFPAFSIFALDMTAIF